MPNVKSLKCRPGLRPVSPNACGWSGRLRCAGAAARHKHSSQSAGKEVAGTWADKHYAQVPGRGEPREAQRHSAFAVHKPEVSTVRSKGHSGMCDKAEKTTTILRVT